VKYALAVLVAVALLTAACSTGGRDSEQPVISVMGPYMNSSADAFADSMLPFTQETGIRVDYIGTTDLANDIQTGLSTGTAPDVAIIPQPGFIAELAERPDGIIPLPSPVVEVVDANYSEEAARIGEVDDVSFGVVYKISPKSLVWYPPSYFDDNELETPSTIAELHALVRDVESDVSPWCFTIFAFAATGWIITDWIEDFLLHQSGPEDYDDWVAGTLPFDSLEVRLAMQSFEDLVLEPGRAFGGPSRYLRNQVSVAQQPMFDSPSNCVLHRQAGFAENWLPDGVSVGQEGDTDVFKFPPVNADDETRVLVGGDTAVIFDDTPELREFMSYLATPASGARWAARGGYTGAHSSVGDLASYYPDPFDLKLAELVLAADVLRFDGSDLMPPSFAATALLETLTAWVSGEIDLDTAVTELDEARNKTTGS